MKDFIKHLFTSKTTQKPNNEIKDEIKVFIKELQEEARNHIDNYTVKLSSVDKYNELKKKPSEFKKDVLFALIKYRMKAPNSHWYSLDHKMEVWTKLLNQLFRMKDLNLDQNDLSDILKDFMSDGKEKYPVSKWPFISVLSMIDKKIQEEGEISYSLQKQLKFITSKLRKKSYLYSEEKKVLDKISRLGKTSSEIKINSGDVLGKSYLSSLNRFEKEKLTEIKKIFPHFSKGKEKSIPSKKWLVESKKLISTIGKEQILELYEVWIEALVSFYKEIHKNKSYEFQPISDENIQILRSAVWTVPIMESSKLNELVEDLGLWSFKKLSGYGALGVKLGNACIYAFSELPYKNGISRLTKFRMKIKYSSVQNLISKAILKVAEKEGKTMDEIEELAVQDFGLDKDFKIIRLFGKYKGIAQIVDVNSIKLFWENEDGKLIKTVPKYVKDYHKENLKEFRANIKEIQTNLSAQKSRIEKMFLSKREWEFDQWKKLYLENRLLSFLGTKLIWKFIEDKKETTAICFKDEFLNPKGTLKINKERTRVRLWHPALAEIEEVDSWRNWLIANEVKQPFKQAHREVYIVTDAERNTNTYSNRFAAHIIRQYIFNALCKERGWGYHLQGQWDSFNTPVLKVPAWGYRIEYWVEGVDESANDMGIFNYLQTDQVRFYDKESQVSMEDVPTIVFSEVMRDVDLFVGVTSIGADPNWRDRGEERFQRYWTDFSFGDLSISGIERKKLLEQIIPKLRIKDKCSFEGNFLVVEGDLRTYKIHLGSGNILMKPNDQYLCIVANRSHKEQKVFLPFDGDSTLSIILSKAFLLSDDKTIKDRTIISQINS